VVPSHIALIAGVAVYTVDHSATVLFALQEDLKVTLISLIVCTTVFLASQQEMCQMRILTKLYIKLYGPEFITAALVQKSVT
jgi:hypothetical protein